MIRGNYRAAVIGRTGRGDYGHSIDLAMVGQPGVTLVAVADDNPEGLARAAKRLNVEHAYADYREMLDREKPQIVAVAPRWIDCHREMILACVERGIHVFSEKPLAPDLESCDAIVEAAKRAHVKLAIALQTRFSPRFEQVKKLIDDGAIGQVLEVRGRGKEDHRGGGEDLMVLGPHVMDLFRGLLGTPSWCFARVTEAGAPISRASVRPGAEGLGPLAGDRVDAIFGFEGTPVVGHFATSRPSDKGGAGRRFAVQVHGSKGMIEIRTGWLPPVFLSQDPSWTASGEKSPWIPVSSAGPGRAETLGKDDLNAANRAIVADLIRAIESDTQPKCSVYDGRAALEMILACHASQVAGGPVTLPLKDRRHPLTTFPA